MLVNYISILFHYSYSHSYVGVTHLPEVQCIDLLSVLGAVRGKDMPDGEHKATPMSSSGSSSDDSGCSSFSEGAGSAAAPPVGDSPFPVLCLVLATDGVWYVKDLHLLVLELCRYDASFDGFAV